VPPGLGLTATPAAHTAAYFTHKAFAYGYEQAVRDGYLVDYDAMRVRSDVRMSGVFLKECGALSHSPSSTGRVRSCFLSTLLLRFIPIVA
jgi:type I restriction enzyme R subunit